VSDEWDNYTMAFNLLSDEMSKAGISVKMLTDLLESYENLPDEYKNQG
jgi:hypothetical protein